jgi:hypothetical protein
MTQKGKSVSAASPSFLMEKIRDFLVTDCGWTDETVADTYDAKHLASGWWLTSVGEDSDTEVFFHVGPVNKGHGTSGTQSNLQAAFSHLNGGCSDTAMSIPVQDGTRFVASGGVFRVDNELINVSAVSGNNLTVATSGRGYLGTTAAVHADKMVVLQEFTNTTPVTLAAAPMIEVCAFRDVTNYIARETTPVAILVGSIAASSVTGFLNNRFTYAWLRITSGTYSGMLRKILSYTSTTGAFTFEPFPAAPGTETFEVISNGFLLPGNRDVTCNYRSLGTFWSPYCRASSPLALAKTYFLYGNKNALFVVGSNSATDHYFAFFGEPIRYAEALTTLTQENVTASEGVVIHVADTSFFKIGQKYRIIGRSVGDWDDNKSVVPGGAGGPTNIAIDEIPTEEILVTDITSSLGHDYITVAKLIFSYRAGAVIGEDPRPSVGGGPGATSMMSGTNMWPIYAPKGIGRVHRSLCGSSPEYYWYNYGSYSLGGTWGAPIIAPEGGVGYTSSDPSYLTERPVCGLLPIRVSDTAYRANNIWEHVKGTLPMIYPFPGGLTLVDQDTVAARWNGAWRTFRAFREANTGIWFVCGPEIA